MKSAISYLVSLTISALLVLGIGAIQPSADIPPEATNPKNSGITELEPGFLAKHGNRLVHGISTTYNRTPALSAAQSENFRVETDVLTVGQTFRKDAGRQLDVTFGYLPNLPQNTAVREFNNRIDTEILSLLKTHAKDTKTSPTPVAQGLPQRGLAKQCGGSLDLVTGRERARQAVGKKSLIIDCDIALASGDIVAERLSVLLTNTSGAHHTDRIIYADLAASLPEHKGTNNGASSVQGRNTVGDFSALVHDHDAFAAVVQQKIADKLAGGSSEAIGRDAEEIIGLQQVKIALERAVFSDRGDLIVPIESDGEGVVGDRLPLIAERHDNGFRMFAVDAKIVTPALNTFGHRVAKAAATLEPSTLQVRSTAGQAHVNCAIVPCMSITFDDGPMGKKTQTVLNALNKYDQAATFFVMGSRANKDPKILQQIHADGHEIGGHTWSHPVLTSLDKKDLKAQFKKTDQAIHKALGKNPIYYRPPYGIWNKDVLKASGQAGILWNVDSDDWRGDSDAKYLKRSLKVSAGDIVLFHDVQPQTVKNIDKLVAEYTARGYYLVTISQLFQDAPLKRGTIVYSR